MKVATFYVQMCDATSPVELDTPDAYRRKLRQQAVRSAWLFSAGCSERPRRHGYWQGHNLLAVSGCSAQIFSSAYACCNVRGNAWIARSCWVAKSVFQLIAQLCVTVVKVVIRGRELIPIVPRLVHPIDDPRCTLDLLLEDPYLLGPSDMTWSLFLR